MLPMPEVAPSAPAVGGAQDAAAVPLCPIAGSGQGRTRWDCVSEAVQGGWTKTARLAVLLLMPGGGVAAGAALVLRLLDEFVRRH